MTDITLGIKITADGTAVITSSKQSVAAIQGVGQAAANANDRTAKSAAAATAATKRQADETVAGANRQKDAIGKLAERFEGLEKSALGSIRALAGLFVVDKAVQLGAAVVTTTAKFEALDTRLKGLTGNTFRFADAQAFLNQTARQQNVLIEGLADSYTKLLPLQRSGLLTTQQVRNLTTGFNDLKAAVGATDAQLGQVFFGLSQGLSAGTLRAEELNQVTEPIPGLLSKLDEAAGLTAGGFRKLVNEGKVTSEMFRDVLSKALQSYAGTASAASDTVGAAITRLQNAVTNALNKPGMRGFFSGVINGIAAAVEGPPEQSLDSQKASIQESLARLNQGRRNPVTDQTIAALQARLDAINVQLLGQAQARDAEDVADIRNQDKATLGARKTRADEALKDFTANAEAREKLQKAERELQEAIKAGLDANGKYAAGLRSVQFQLESLKDPVAEQLKGMRDETRLLDEVGVGRAKQEALLKAEQAAVQRGIPLSAEERGAVLAAADARYRKAQSLQAEAEALDKLDAAAKAELANMLDAERARRQAIIDRDQLLRDRSKAIGGDVLDLRERRAARTGDGATVFDIGVERAKRWKEEQLKGLDQAAAGYQDFADKVQQVFEGQVEQAFRDAEEVSADWRDGLKRGLRELKESTGDWASFTQQSMRGAFQVGEDLFVKFARTGKLSIADLGRYIQETLARAFYRRTVGNGIEQFGGSFMDMVGSWFGPSSTASASSGSTAWTPGGVWHSGGRVGDPAPQRLVPSHFFDGAPRYHSGVNRIGHDERPAILKVGERVLTEGQAAAMDRMGGGTVVQIIDQRRSGTVDREEETGPDGRKLVRMTIRDEVTRDMRRNGPIGQGLQDGFGARRAATVRG